jgi:hypothetical protein
MKDIDDPDGPQLFKCFICGKYKDIKMCNPLFLKDVLFPKDICDDCYNEAKKSIVKAPEAPK